LSDFTKSHHARVMKALFGDRPLAEPKGCGLLSPRWETLQEVAARLVGVILILMFLNTMF